MARIPETLLIDALLQGYRSAQFTPTQVADWLLERSAAQPELNMWITRLSRAQVLAHARAVEKRSPDELPLYGIPFAIKDSIDLAGVPTSCGCPGYAYTPQTSAPVVQRLLDAGAIPFGKTNLDQLATGLVGTRSPYGAGRNAVDPEYISGGSSSGSALAVATGLVSFALATDTAGSGRVPAAFNNIVGLKPTRGTLSPRGLVPACRSIDCMSIMALCAGDADRVLGLTAAFDPEEPYSRSVTPSRAISDGSFRFGVPRPDQLEFFGDADYARLTAEAYTRLEALGGERLEVDFAPLFEAGALLYGGPWLAERYAEFASFIEAGPERLLPLTRQIIEAGAGGSAADAFRAQYQLKALQRECERLWERVDYLATPTAGTIYRIRDVETDPVRLNTNLGRYTTFANLLDLAVVAVPSGFRGNGLPFGLSLLGPAGSDRALLARADAFQRASQTGLGALGLPLPRELPAVRPAPGDAIPLAVCGAHMSGLPLNHQLQERGARLLQRTRTAPRYRLYALPGGPPERPGLVRTPDAGAAIELEVWSVPAERLGSFVAAIPAPLGIGKLELEDGTFVCGFLCESHALAQATDITNFAGWRGYLASRS